MRELLNAASWMWRFKVPANECWQRVRRGKAAAAEESEEAMWSGLTGTEGAAGYLACFNKKIN